MEPDQADIQPAETVPEPTTGEVYVSSSGDVEIGAPTALIMAVPPPADREVVGEVA